MQQALKRYDEASAILPGRLRMAALALPQEQRARAREFRLRSGQQMSVLLDGEEHALDVRVSPDDLESLCDLATEYSRYASAETIKDGYLPVKGGFRVGLCGTAVMKSGENTNLRDLSSAAIRISREIHGIASETAKQLFQNGRFCNTLILSPPGGGKTTFLRDLVRSISSGDVAAPRRVSLIDERGELAVCWQGMPQLDVGSHTDILDGCPKALGIPMVLRAMNPEIIAVDEITAPADIEAMEKAFGCGVGLLATVHSGSVEEMAQRPLYKRLLSVGIFRLAVCIAQKEDSRIYRVEELP